MTDQGFNTYFNLIDNFTSKFDAIHKRITSVTRDKYVVDFGVSNTSVKNSSDAVKKVMGDMEGLQDAFSQPLSLTVTDLISGNLAAIGRQLDILRAKAIIPVGLSTGAAAAGLAVGVVGVAAVGMGVAATIPAAADLEASMIRVNKLIGMEGEAAKGVQKDMQDMMMATGMGLDQIAAAYETAGGAGIGGDLMAAGDMEGARKEISDFVRITLEASSAFNMTADATSSMLSGIANIYKPMGEETNDFLRSVGSGIDAVADATIASEEKIMTAMSHASTAMAMFKQTDETVKGTIALSAALISTNMSGDTAGEAIKDFFTWSKRDTDNKISQSLGMSSDEFQEKLVADPMAIVEAVNAKYNSMALSDQGAYAKLFGDTGAKIPQLSGSANFQASLQKAQDVVNPSYDAGTKMSESFGKSLAGTRTQLEKIYQTVTVFAQVIGSVFLPGLNAVLRVVNAILTPLAMFIRYVAELAGKIPGLNLVAAVVGITFMASVIGTLLIPAITGLIATYEIGTKATLIFQMWTNLLGKAFSFTAIKTGIMTIATNVYSLATKGAAAATAALSAAAYANTGASNISWSAKLRLAAANIYASVATRAHTLATIINRATAMASVGAIAALAVIHGVLTGSITLTTAATWALNVAMAVLDALNPFTYIIAGALILAGLVGLVAYKSGLLGTIWKDLSKIKFGKIFDDLVKGDFDGAWKRLSKGMAIAWEDVKGDITLKFGGNFETIVNYVRMLVSLASRMFPVHAKALGVLTDTQSIFGWMYSLWKSFWSWLGSVLNTLISAFPGGTKSLAKSEWEEAMEKSGITYSEGKYYQSEPTAITTWDDALKKWTNYEAGHGAEVTPSKDILALQARYEGEKGFIESLPGIDELNTAIDEIKKVFQGVSDSFDGFVDTLTKFKDSIVSQFSNFIKNVFPWAGGAEVTPTFEGYKEYVENAKKGSENYRMYTKTSDEVLRAAYTEGQTGIPQEHPYIDEYEYNLLVSGYKKYSEYGASSTSPALPSLFSNMPTGNLSPHETEVNRHAGDIDYEASKQRGIAAGLTLGDAKSYTNGKETISPKAWGTLDSDQKEHWIPQYAVGATFKKDGLFAGRVHAPEEIIPQATAQRGAGPIARALDTLYGVTAGKGPSSSSQKTDVHIHDRYEGEKGFIESLPGIDELNTTIDEIKKVFKGVSDSFDSFVDTLTKFKDSIVSQFSNFINKITNAVPWYNNEGGEIDKAKILDTLKSARTDDGERLFDFQDETLMAAIEEAITGVPQEVGNLTKPAKYARAVNKAKELINKPDYRTEGAAAPSTVEKLTGLAESLTSGGAELLTNVGLPTAVTTPTSPVYWNKMGEGITADEFTELSPGERTSGNWIYDAFRKILPESDESNAKSYTNGKETISPKAWGTLDSDQKEHWIPQYAVGATFKKDGLFAGRVHAPEEIIPQATAQRGAGPIARALDTLHGVTAGSSPVEKLTGLAESLTSRGAELLTNVGLPTAVTTSTSPVYWNKMGEGITADEFTELSPGERTSGNWIYDAFRKILPESDESNAKSYTNGKETISPKAWGTLDSDQKEHWIPQYAVGATFKKDGLFAGRVHAPEEIIPQATAQRGAGPIARALDTLHGVTAGGRASSGSQKTEIHIHEHNDFSGMRVSSAIDVDKLMRDIERKIRGGSISAVRKQIEQGRT